MMWCGKCTHKRTWQFHFNKEPQARKRKTTKDFVVCKLSLTKEVKATNSWRPGRHPKKLHCGFSSCALPKISNWPWLVKEWQVGGLLDLIQHRNCYRLMYSNSPCLRRQYRSVACTSVFLLHYSRPTWAYHKCGFCQGFFFLQNRYKNERKKCYILIPNLTLSAGCMGK